MEEVEDVRAVRFKVLPRFKVRSDRERVRAGDQVLLVPDFDESRYLHAAAWGGLGTPCGWWGGWGLPPEASMVGA